MIDGGSNVTEVMKDGRSREAWVSSYFKHSCKVFSIHPIHHEHMVVFPKEVVSSYGEIGVWSNREKGSRLHQKFIPIKIRQDRPELERDFSIVLMIERSNNTALTAYSDLL